MRPSSTCRALRRATCTLVATLGACSPAADEMGWARSALERNDRLEVVAEDPQARTFTVRLKDSNELRIVRIDELAATVPQARGAAPAAPASAASEPADAQPSAEPAPASPPPAETLEEETREPAQAAAPAVPPAAAGDGRLIASGPGYSIQAADRTGGAARAAPETAAAAATERRTEPLVCQGARFMHIDNRTITFTGDAVVAEDGCELHITNSRIAAGGVGLAVRGANVHIKNSTVAGDSGAIHASGNAQIYTQSSRFRGMVRRLDDAVLHDMGQNVWN